MRANRFCHKLLSNTSLHKTRLKLVSDVVETILLSKSLSVTHVGRKMVNGNKTRSNIRKTDRLYSNSHFYLEREEIYQTICSTVVKTPNPLIAIDGSKLPNSPWYILRASLVRQGRAITLFEQQYEPKEHGDRKLYKRFLKGLAGALGKEVSPILITDAEFRGPWFKLVRSNGWDYIGRIRGNANVSLNEGEEADSWQDLWPKANNKPKYLGEGCFNRTNEVYGHFYLFKGKNKKSHAHTRSGRRSRTKKSNRHKNSAREPWLLISSLEEKAKNIIRAYQFRMSIEENFRDLKSGRYGLGLKMTFSKQKKRYSIMLILAALAALIAYLVGVSGELNNIHWQFQANSVRSKRVLSRFFLGCEMFYKRINITIKQWTEAILYSQQEIVQAFEEALC